MPSLARTRAEEHVPREPLVLHRLVEEALDHQQARDEGHTYRIDRRSEDTIVEGDGVLLERVLVNLLGNAAKYSPRGCPVTAIVESSGGEVRVAIQDEGAGLDSDEIEQLFEPFYRSPAHRASVSGAGLGLTVCKRAIEALGGRMWARRLEPGGAEFGFALPGSRLDPDAAWGLGPVVPAGRSSGPASD